MRIGRDKSGPYEHHPAGEPPIRLLVRSRYMEYDLNTREAQEHTVKRGE